jgi:hypothetical protein
VTATLAIDSGVATPRFFLPIISIPKSIIGEKAATATNKQKKQRAYQLVGVDDAELELGDPAQPYARVPKVLARLRELGRHGWFCPSVLSPFSISRNEIKLVVS